MVLLSRSYTCSYRCATGYTYLSLQQWNNVNSTFSQNVVTPTLNLKLLFPVYDKCIM